MDLPHSCQIIIVCPSCKKFAMDPTICFQCNAEIPPSTRIKVLDKHNRVHEITGYHLNNFSTNTFAFLKHVLPPSFSPPVPPPPPPSFACRPKGTTFTSGSRNRHSKSCACFLYLKTEEEARKSYLEAEEGNITEEADGNIRDEANGNIRDEADGNIIDEADVPNQPAAEEHIPDSRPAWIDAVRRVLSIYEEDMACLADGQLLNDSVIDCYLNYIYYEIIPPEFKGRTHIFNTCFNRFLKTVFEEENPNKNWSAIQKSVLRWVKDVDIFSKDFIFVPVNRRDHWYLAVVCFVSQVVNPQESLEDDSFGAGCSFINLANRESLMNNPFMLIPKDASHKHHPYNRKGRPCVLYFDSASTEPTVGKEKVSFAGSLIQFLQMVWYSQNPTEPRDWSPVVCYKMICPQQNNVSDCGLYLLQFAESFFKNPIPNIGEVMPSLIDWFPRFVIERKRMEVKGVLSKLVVPRPQTANSSCSSDVVMLSSEDQS